MISAFAVPQFGQVIVDSKIMGITHANMKPSTTKTAPRERTHVARAVTAGLPQATPGAHAAMRRRRQSSTAPPLPRQIMAMASSANRCGAANHATATSHAVPRPSEPSSKGRAQQDAAPKAAARPPAASSIAPVSRAGARSAVALRVSSIIVLALLIGFRHHAKPYSRYRHKPVAQRGAKWLEARRFEF